MIFSHVLYQAELPRHSLNLFAALNSQAPYQELRVVIIQTHGTDRARDRHRRLHDRQMVANGLLLSSSSRRRSVLVRTCPQLALLASQPSRKGPEVSVDGDVRELPTLRPRLLAQPGRRCARMRGHAPGCAAALTSTEEAAPPTQEIPHP